MVQRPEVGGERVGVGVGGVTQGGVGVVRWWWGRAGRGLPFWQKSSYRPVAFLPFWQVLGHGVFQVCHFGRFFIVVLFRDLPFWQVLPL